MTKTVLFFATFICMLAFSECADTSRKNIASKTPASPLFTATNTPVNFNEYWYQGKAELSTFDVEQERYGEMRTAEQVNIFVTEDFSRKKQVKLDDPNAAGSDRVPILKMNSVRHFHTGIYDYATMQSVFTPADGSSTLKATCTVQDWCGQVFMQYNLDKDAYRSRSFSYFETEGDTEVRLPVALFEDELWTRIRLDPATVPTGKMLIIPSALYVRMRHKPAAAMAANLSLEPGDRESTLRLTYQDIQRSLAIRFESSSPYRILGWEEINDGKTMSKGTLKALRVEPYWSQNSHQFDSMRDSLHLNF